MFRVIGGVLGVIFQRLVVIVDLPENALAFMIEHAEIMLAPRVVVLGEGIEHANLLKDRLAVVAVESWDGRTDRINDKL